MERGDEGLNEARAHIGSYFSYEPRGDVAGGGARTLICCKSARMSSAGNSITMRVGGGEIALRVAGSLGLADDQRYSLLSRHDAEVTSRALAAHPGLSPGPHRPPPRHRHRRRPSVTAGWAAWFGNRRVSMRDRWFRLRTRGSYRGAPQV